MNRGEWLIIIPVGIMIIGLCLVIELATLFDIVNNCNSQGYFIVLDTKYICSLEQPTNTEGE